MAKCGPRHCPGFPLAKKRGSTIGSHANRADKRSSLVSLNFVPSKKALKQGLKLTISIGDRPWYPSIWDCQKRGSKIESHASHADKRSPLVSLKVWPPRNALCTVSCATILAPHCINPLVSRRQIPKMATNFPSHNENRKELPRHHHFTILSCMTKVRRGSAALPSGCKFSIYEV